MYHRGSLTDAVWFDQDNSSNGWMSVPQFGDWDMKNGVPDYSVDFSKIRENRKQNKSDFSRASLGNEEELVAANNHKVVSSGDTDNSYTQLNHLSSTENGGHSPSARKKFASYFVCCIGA